jgi:hypothetical protein
MGLTRSVALVLLIVPFVAACNEDNEFGLGTSKPEDRFSATLSGANVRPVPVATSATATAQISIKDPQVGQSTRSLAFVITTTNLTSATAAHIHLGGASVGSGPIIATLYANPTDTAITASQLASGTLLAGALGAISLDSLAVLVSNGATYVDIHTTGNPSGLLRGQLVKSGQQAVGELFAAPALSGAKERPTPVVSTALGSATFEMLTSSSVRYKVDVAGITGATMAHIHTAVADSAGPVAVTLFTTATPTGPLAGTLASGTFSSANIQLPGISLDSLLSLMRRGRTYVNVHTVANPSGEIRAQIEPVSVLPK